MRTLLLMALGVLGVSLSGPLMASMVVPPLAIAFWRNGFAAAGLGFDVAARRREELTLVRGRTLRLTLLAGVALAVHFGTWVTALTLTSVASATALVCLQIAFVVAWEMLRGQHFGPLVLVGLVVAFAGVLIVSGVDLTLSHRALIGDLLALAGAVGGAAYIVVGSRVRQAVSTTTYTFGCYGSCALLLLVACLVAGQPLGGYPASQWVLLLTVTLTSHLFGHSVFNHLLANTSPTMVSLALLLEVPGASVLAAVILGQVPPPAAVLGLLVVLSGMALVVVGNQNAVVEQAPVDLVG